MRRVSDGQISLHLNSLVSGGLSVNDAIHDQSRDTLIHHYMAAERNKICSISQPLFSQIHLHQLFHSHADLLYACPRPHGAVPAGDIPEGIALLVANIKAGKGLSGPQRDMATLLRPLAIGESHNKFKKGAIQTLVQDHASWKPKSNEEGSTVSKLHPTVTVAGPGSTSRQFCRSLKDRASVRNAICSRVRRARIAKALKAFRELIPDSEKCGQDALLDDVIDHLNFLNLQIKVLSQNRLHCEAMSEPFIHIELEYRGRQQRLNSIAPFGSYLSEPRGPTICFQHKGYGHYLLHDLMESEPLGELMGQIMESKMPAAIQLLESKGLYLMPVTSEHDFLQTN
ncbi:transcription factor bHLH7-like isoform X2 [Tasmannia lanceolata]